MQKLYPTQREQITTQIVDLRWKSFDLKTLCKVKGFLLNVCVSNI